MKKLLLLLLTITVFIFTACGDSDSKPGEEDGAVLDGITETILMIDACGLSDVVPVINEDIYTIYNVMNIDENSFLGKDNGFMPINFFKKAIENYRNCVKNSTNCDELSSCLNIEVTADTCDGKTYQESCDGNKRIICNWQGKVIKVDCGSQTCKEKNGNARCELSKNSCDDTTYVSNCDRNIAQGCDFGRIIKTDCSLNGSTCKMVQEHGMNRAVCEPLASWPDCDEQTYKDSCEGKYVVTCYRGKVVKNDCEKLAGEGFVCKENPDMTDIFMFAGCVYNKISTPCTSEPKCNGNVLEYCVNGETKTYDCTANDYAACSTEKAKNENGEIKDVALCTF